MKRNQKVEGTIYLKIKFEDIFPEEWDDDDIAEFIQKRIDEYVEVNGEYEIDDITVDYSEVDRYGSDDLYGI